MVRAPRGTEISCKGWQQEAALRMLMNNLDPEVAERPDELVVYGGAGKAARDWESFDAIVATLRRLKDDETLLVQSGKPVGVFQTHEYAPRVLIANANLVGDWANWDEFRRLDALGLTMYGQMTAGRWIYIGTQGILQGTYETFAAAGQKHFGGDLSGRLVLTAGLGGMGGAQPLAVTMNGGVAPLRRGRPGAHPAPPRDRLPRRRGIVAGRGARAGRRGGRRRRSRSASACSATPPTCIPELVRRGVTPDLVTDQTSAHDTLNGYVPNGMTLDEALELRRATPTSTCAAPWPASWSTCEAMVALQKAGAARLRLRQQHPRRGEGGRLRRRLRLPRLRAGLHPAALLPRQRALPLGGARRRPADIAAPTPPCSRPSPTTRWSPAGSAWPPRRSTSRACPAASAGWSTASAPRRASSSTTWCARGKVKAPIVIGRDHLDSGSVASPYRETESMMDGSDAIADWPILNALLNTAAGASWVSFHHGGGVGIGKSLHAGMVVVADGTDMMAERLQRVLTTDPGTGVMRHADAGYPEAVEKAHEAHIDLPMVDA